MCRIQDGFVHKTPIRAFLVIAECSEQSGWKAYYEYYVTYEQKKQH